MKAIRIEQFGGPAVLQLQDIPVPDPEAGEVLVGMAHAGINVRRSTRHQEGMLDQDAGVTGFRVPSGSIIGLRGGPLEPSEPIGDVEPAV